MIGMKTILRACLLPAVLLLWLMLPGVAAAYEEDAQDFEDEGDASSLGLVEVINNGNQGEINKALEDLFCLGSTGEAALLNAYPKLNEQARRNLKSLLRYFPARNRRCNNPDCKEINSNRAPVLVRQFEDIDRKEALKKKNENTAARQNLAADTGVMRLDNMQQILKALESGDGEKQRTAAEVAGRMGSRAEKALPQLYRLATTSYDTAIRHATVNAIGKIATPYSEGNRMLADLLRSPKPEIRQEALMALTERGPQAADMVPLVLKVNLPTDDEKELELVIEFCMKVGPEATERLKLAAKGLDKDARKHLKAVMQNYSNPPGPKLLFFSAHPVLYVFFLVLGVVVCCLVIYLMSRRFVS